MFNQLPSATNIMASSSPYFTAFFADWIWIVYAAVGVFAAVAFVRFLINVFAGGFHQLTHRTPTVSQNERESKAGSWEASRAMYELHNK